MVFASSRDLDHAHTDKQNGLSSELYPRVVLYLLVFYLPLTRLTAAVKSFCIPSSSPKINNASTSSAILLYDAGSGVRIT